MPFASPFAATFPLPYAPVVLQGSLRQTAMNRVTVTFPENVLVFDPSGDRDALNRSLWSSVLVGSGEDRLIQHIEQPLDDRRIVHLYFDGELTPGSMYQVLGGL